MRKVRARDDSGVVAVISALASQFYGGGSVRNRASYWIYWSPGKCPLRCHGEQGSCDSPLKNQFWKKWWERGTFFIRTTNDNVSKPVTLGLLGGSVAYHVDWFLQVPPVGGVPPRWPWLIGLAGRDRDQVWHRDSARLLHITSLNVCRVHSPIFWQLLKRALHCSLPPTLKLELAQ